MAMWNAGVLPLAPPPRGESAMGRRTLERERYMRPAAMAQHPLQPEQGPEISDVDTNATQSP
jgi:hypothetical protein